MLCRMRDRRGRVAAGRTAVRAGALAAVLAVGLTAAACGGGSAPARTIATVPPEVTIAPPRSPTARPSPTADPGVTLAFAGDVHFAGRVEQRLADAGTALGPISRTLAAADVAMVNLETAVTTRGTPEPKSFHFRAPPSAFEALRAAGVDVTSMANNHAVDYGPVGLQDSLAAIRSSGFPVVGIGRDYAEAYAPWYTTVRGHRIAVLGASQIPDRTLQAWTAQTATPGIASAFSKRLVAAVRLARKNAEIVVVYLHWGQEGNSCPLPEQVSLAEDLAAAGADAVVGTHAHLLLGGGWKGRTYVAYGLGNFLWWRDNAYSNDTGVLTLTFHGRNATRAVFTPAEIDARGVPLPATGGDAARITAKWNKVRECSGLADAPPR
jgi:Bacterial capsule synthesis protein PGA_cap